MATNTLYVTTKTLEPYFVNRTTGEPLAGGTVTFYKDNNRVQLKNVYQLTGAPPNYTFAPLPNPITLSAVGTIQNAGGDNVALYYLPFVSDNAGAAEELYYVVVKDSDGNVQFTREGWPGNDDASGGGGSATAEGTVVNEISNPQFVDVLFIPGSTYSYSYSGLATTVVPIAPDWDLVISHTNAGTITVARNTILGSSNVPTNPPYTLTITPGANITTLKLRQRFTGNPDIWVPSTVGSAGYINAGLLLGANTSAVIRYEPSVGTAQEILNESNSALTPAYFSNTVQLTPGDNTQAGGTGYVDITIQLSTSVASTLSSIQIIGLQTNDSDVVYRQDSVNRQKYYLFHYYNPLLQFKPIPSYLIGWSFPTNPAQFGVSLGPFATGANTSNYTWDNTIVFQSANSGFTVSNGTSGAIRVTAAVDTRVALIQYIDAGAAEQAGILFESICSMVEAVCQSGSYTATVSIWYTTDASLPNIAANASLVASLDANGKPATFNGNWTEVTRGKLGDARFTVTIGGTTNPGFQFNYYPFSGWGPVVNAGAETFIAIVVGTGTISAGNNFSVQSISMQPGNIPTIPAPESAAQTLLKCQEFYEKSSNVGVAVAQNLGTNTGETVAIQVVGAATGAIADTVNFKVTKRTTPTVTLYNPNAANAQLRNQSAGADCAGSAVVRASESSFVVGYVSAGGSAAGQMNSYHWSADARLGF